MALVGRLLRLVCTLAILVLAFLPTLPMTSASADEKPLNKVSVSTDKGTFSWDVELAADDESRQTGLMFRKSMAPGSGMLFQFENSRPVAMWMKNTFVPLDMIFTNDAGVITHIHLGAVPQSLDIIRSNGPASYVLEINAGEAETTGLQKGARLQHPWFGTSQ